ncbi:DHH family phosphoesterase [Paenibacillus sp. MBLB4367]|uniref:DHH family phosphoesterase n=1 Tax=Paenibacillus sp. MBLB4367 TaxID=3384767 RepID=UPI003908396E
MTTAPTSYESQLSKAAAFIREHDDFLVVSHLNPDGDAASSTLAVGWMLERLNKTFVMINESPVPQKFDCLWGYGRIVDYSDAKPERTFRTIISVDCADFPRIGDVSNLFEEGFELLNIDHHPTNDGFGSVQLIRPDAAATAEILYDVAVSLGMQWDEPLCRCIYTGMLTDTGGFRYSNTSPNVMRIAAEMIQHGVKGYELAERFLENLTFAQVLLLRKALSTLSFANDRQIAWVSVSLDDMSEAGATKEDSEGLVNYPRNIEGVEVGILFRQANEHTVKVSLRSASRVDVSAIAQSFGGGGHVRASGCTVEGTIEQVIARVVKEVGQVLG